MNREQFFQESSHRLHREGFTRSRNRMNCFLWSGMVPPPPDYSGRRRSLLAGGCSDAGTGTSPSEPPIWPAPCGST